MDNLKKPELTASILPYSKIFRIRNTNLQFRNPGYGWQKNEKKEEKKNTGNVEVLCVTRRRKNLNFLLLQFIPC